VNLDRTLVRASGQDAGTPRFVTRSIGSDTIVVPICSGVGELDAVYTLNEVGSRIWQLLAEPCSILRLAEVVCAEYEVSMATASADIVEVLDALESRGLVRPVVENGQ
jgi:hypothetical protein